LTRLYGSDLTARRLRLVTISNAQSLASATRR